jgi:putative resolvase
VCDPAPCDPLERFVGLATLVDERPYVGSRLASPLMPAPHKKAEVEGTDTPDHPLTSLVIGAQEMLAPYSTSYADTPSISAPNGKGKPTEIGTTERLSFTTKLLSIGKSASILGVSPQCLRNWERIGKIKPLYTIGGTRKYSLDMLNRLMNIEEGNQLGNPLAMVCRVSSRGQGKASNPNNTELKSSLEHQVDRVKAYCLEKYGRLPDREFVAVRGGLNFSHPQFLLLVKAIIRGELKGGIICVQDPSRIMRFSTKLIEFLCEEFGVRVEYLLEHEEQNDLTADLMDVITHFTAKFSGNKNKKILGIEIEPDILEKCFRWKRYEHLSGTEIAKRLRDEGAKDQRGNYYKSGLIHKKLRQNWATLCKLFPADG